MLGCSRGTYLVAHSLNLRPATGASPDRLCWLKTTVVTSEALSPRTY